MLRVCASLNGPYTIQCLAPPSTANGLAQPPCSHCVTPPRPSHVSSASRHRSCVCPGMQPSRDHFTVADFEKMGQFFCDTLLDYCDPDQSKVRSTLRDLDIIHPAAGGSSSSGVGGSAAGGQGSSGQGAARDGGPMDDSDDSDQGDAADGDGALLASTTSAAAASGGKRGGNSGESKRPRRRPSKGRRQGRASVSTSTQSGASASGSVVGGGSSAGGPTSHDDAKEGSPSPNNDTWVRGNDPNSGHPYWYNQATGTSSWKDPATTNSQNRHCVDEHYDSPATTLKTTETTRPISSIESPTTETGSILL